ncbi:hypothetical protein A2962_04505 [Candidatus Woesebacteria bacterium RIFCSPLOWO2_01_FULL_39_61]|uniref:Response regulatory domain-containing protein n=1 Tax=Candidatus Woesebacteria bacterium RIFCSPHIGHO2_02_FULL_39_13 TaxID=1802505 RepID=A0A1F7YYH1_9BACT|nr:MAG: hypothetical protein A2692_05815 [Candidatus Woesebacteria bacterium RIFCSPHIGHO2_01_FULL_39_95]OGM31929.1 MAG: hypothetical protein A3D01_00670 [Candidatus Woesebacteria bacterium RIFCSPHIGHO2_02_FULL_39_13]OGM36493.1 MAG: hypothetical protein A3E13_02445 [Candidatus Woesebacteria bacterium RIFCSPHIGHO2_12_FULL_40_20]OGM65515.1 MAG: hypothetical protein A2962_04505 [Candidatus Woesebacteria bacterium RIFCSPLOWO2_01_FULL_39_61]
MATIVVVDPGKIWLDFLCGLFGDNGCGVMPFTNLADAKVALETNLVDLIICEATVLEPGDGILWARELLARGQRAVLLAYSGSHRGNDPKILSKAAINANLPAQLLELLT